MNKKALIVSNNALSRSSNNGKTLNSFFSDFKQGSVSQIFFNDDVPDSDVANSFYKITGRDQFLSLFKKNRYCAGEEIKISPSVSEKKYIKKPPFSRFTYFVNANLEALKLIFRDVLYRCGLNKNQKILSWIREQNPSFIFFVVGNSLFPISFVIYISRFFSIPIFVYITDDYVVYNEPSGLFGSLYRSALIKSYKALFSSANSIFFVCSEMRREFKRVYGVDGDCLINCNFVTAGNRQKRTHKKHVKVVFAGGLHLGRADSLVKFSQYMSGLCDEAGFSFDLDVYTNDSEESLKLPNCQQFGILFKGGISWPELQAKLVEGDFLLHLESFDSKNIKKTKLSLSTKIPEYLSSGTCVIAFGPENLASIKIFKEEAIGIAISHNNTPSEQLKLAITDEAYRDEIALKAKKYAEDHFSPRIIRSRLINKIMEI